MTSIRDVAKIAGVSPATVSRVMNGTANVTEDKRRKVEEAIAKTGFCPNELARALYKKSSRIIGVIVPDIENPFFSELAKAVEDEAYQKGYRMLLCSSGNKQEKEIQNIQMLVQMKADGIIIMTNCAGTGQVLKTCPVPVILVDRTVEGVNENALVESDHYKGGYLAAEHLVECGCKNIVCLREPSGYSSGHRRYKAYQDVCQKYGLEEQYINCTYDYEAGRTAAQEALEKYPKLDGIIAGNDMAAMAVYKQLKKMGKKIPEEIQLIGFDDVNFGRVFTPELTTIHQPIQKMGTVAAQIVECCVEGKDYEKRNIFDVRLVERETTRKK